MLSYPEEVLSFYAREVVECWAKVMITTDGILVFVKDPQQSKWEDGVITSV